MRRSRERKEGKALRRTSKILTTTAK